MSDKKKPCKLTILSSNPLEIRSLPDLRQPCLADGQYYPLPRCLRTACSIICFDMDGTLTKGHWTGQEPTVDHLKQCLPYVSQLGSYLQQLLDSRKQIFVVTFSDDRMPHGGIQQVARIIQACTTRWREIRTIAFYPGYYQMDLNKNQHLAILAQVLKCQHEDILLIDDDPNNITSALQAGYKVYHVPNGLHRVLSF